LTYVEKRQAAITPIPSTAGAEFDQS